jgi:hypothetical protein
MEDTRGEYNALRLGVDKISDYLILKKEAHQLQFAGWMRGMPEDAKSQVQMLDLQIPIRA